MLPPFEPRPISDAVSAGAVSARAIALEALERASRYERIQPAVWIERLSAEAVLAYADDVDARVAAGEVLPLAGVPFAIKDNLDLEGVPTTAACPDFSYVPTRSAEVVRRLIEAGAVPIGKTNLDQFATGLNGTRSPYGAPRCVYNLAYVSGGSSSGSAVAVAAGLVAFSLGTDTAGSGRVPAAFNGLVGYKPTRGRWSTSGLVPACRSLDCVSAFAPTLDGVELIDAVVACHDPKDPYSRRIEDRGGGVDVVGVPRRDHLSFLGDGASERLFHAAVKRLEACGFKVVEVDFDFLREAAALLYDGPWAAERLAALEGILSCSPDAVHPVVRDVVERGGRYTAVETFRAQYQLEEHRRRAEELWQGVDMLLLPTAPTIFRVTEMLREPVALNSALGLYTNFVNLLDMAAIAVPAGHRPSGTGFGVTMIGPAWTESRLLAAANRYLDGREDIRAPDLDHGGRMEYIRLAVVGAHLEGMPLHWQLTSRSARFVERTTTSSSYRLYAMARSVPPKPALVHSTEGAAIEVEVYELDVASFGSFVAEVPAPLAIGSVDLADGTTVKGFVAEPRALAGAEDVTHLGSWRAYVGRS